MRSLGKPSFSLNNVLDSCIASKQQNRILIDTLQQYRNSLISYEEGYSQKGTAFELYQIAFPSVEALLPVQKELVPLYEKTFVKSVRTRPFYEALITSAKGQICPFCGERAVASLDHYLAKSLHPDLSLTPLNLVPACSDCNKGKGDSHPSCAEEQVFHPYFDCMTLPLRQAILY